MCALLYLVEVADVMNEAVDSLVREWMHEDEDDNTNLITGFHERNYESSDEEDSDGENWSV